MDPLHTFLTTASANALLLAGIVYIFKRYDDGNKSRIGALEEAVKECETDRRDLNNRFNNHLLEEAKQAQ